MNLIASSIPAFFILIGVELWVAHRRGRRVTRFNDAVTDLGCGISSQVVGLLGAAARFFAYVWVFESLRLWTLPEGSGWTLILAIVGVDFLYYWWHRLSHEVNVLWAAHIVHHQSEDYNLAVALRQAWFTSWTSVPFYLPLAVLGVPPVSYAIANGIVTLYQFWIHTELIRRLGPLEHVLNTPSHHRVHHAINPGYLDRNYAGMFIVWDRLFGSFAPEREAPIYGITKPLRSLNPMWANFHHWVEIGARIRAATSWRDRLWAPFAPPAWVPAGAPEAVLPEPGVARDKYDPPVSWRMVAYVGLQLAITSVGTVLVLFGYRGWSQVQLVVAVTLVVAATLTAGALMEHRRWAWPLELSRLVLSAVAISALWI